MLKWNMKEDADARVSIRLVDFGISAELDPDVGVDLIAGTLEYAAPEVFKQGTTYSEKVDNWSIGVITYEMLVGSLPVTNRD